MAFILERNRMSGLLGLIVGIIVGAAFSKFWIYLFNLIKDKISAWTNKP